MGIITTIFFKNCVFKFQNFTNLNQFIFSSFRLKSHKVYFYFFLKSTLKNFFITPNFYFLFSKNYKKKRYFFSKVSLKNFYLPTISLSFEFHLLFFLLCLLLKHFPYKNISFCLAWYLSNRQGIHSNVQFR